MTSHENICMNCFTELEALDGNVCPRCGWTTTKPQVADSLKYNTVLNERYIVGRAKSRNGEGFTYSALDRLTNQIVDVREFFPSTIASRSKEDNTVITPREYEVDFDDLMDDFIDLSRNISRMKEITVISTIIDIFEENYTAYAVYEYTPAVTLRKYITDNGIMSWNQVQNYFMPVLTALGLMNSLGVSHLGISPETIKVTTKGNLLITGFSINAARRTNTVLEPEIFAGCAAIEQYRDDGICSETTDVYGFAATLMYAISGSLPNPATERIRDGRLMIAKEYLQNLPPYGITALANALQVMQEQRTVSFERFKSELSADTAPVVMTDVSNTGALRRLPSMKQNIPQNKGVPPFVWLIGTCALTLIALIAVAVMWLKDADMSFDDIKAIFIKDNSITESAGTPNMLGSNFELWQQKVDSDLYNFELKVLSREFNDTVEEGYIISQDPAPGEIMGQDNTVYVTVSRGSSMRTLPEIRGYSFVELSEVLEKQGFKVVKEDESNFEVALGNVIRYKDRNEGDSVEYGSEIVLVVSTGPAESEPEPNTGEQGE